LILIFDEKIYNNCLEKFGIVVTVLLLVSYTLKSNSFLNKDERA
jgi:hypothetical protein